MYLQIFVCVCAASCFLSRFFIELLLCVSKSYLFLIFHSKSHLMRLGRGNIRTKDEQTCLIFSCWFFFYFEVSIIHCVPVFYTLPLHRFYYSKDNICISRLKFFLLREQNLSDCESNPNCLHSLLKVFLAVFFSTLALTLSFTLSSFQSISNVVVWLFPHFFFEGRRKTYRISADTQEHTRKYRGQKWMIKITENMWNNIISFGFCFGRTHTQQIVWK